MKEVILSNGLVSLVDDEDLEKVSAYNWHAKPQGGTVYAQAAIGELKTYASGKSGRMPVRMHRFILGLKKGDGTIVDHVNGNGLDNRRANLRLSTKSLNAANGFRSRKGRTGFKGTYFDGRWPLRKPWIARISVMRRMISLGMFATEEEAARAYDVAAMKHFGPHARLNFPFF